MAKRVLTKQELEEMGILKTVLVSTSDEGVPAEKQPSNFEKHKQAAETFRQQTGVYDISGSENSRL